MLLPRRSDPTGSMQQLSKRSRGKQSANGASRLHNRGAIDTSFLDPEGDDGPSVFHFLAVWHVTLRPPPHNALSICELLIRTQSICFSRLPEYTRASSTHRDRCRDASDSTETTRHRICERKCKLGSPLTLNPTDCTCICGFFNCYTRHQVLFTVQTLLS